MQHLPRPARLMGYLAVFLAVCVLAVFTFTSASCLGIETRSVSPGLDVTARILDMTYAYDDTTIYWPTATSFQLEQVAHGRTEKGYFYASNDYSASEHGGTHVDAPIHFAEGGKTLGQIPLESFIGPAVKIDVTGKCMKQRDYLLTVGDILDWEKRHGEIPEKAWVIMYTGFDTRYWPDRKKILGTSLTGAEAVPLLRFPGFSPEAADFLVTERDINGIAIDTPSIDRGKSTLFETHQVMCGAGKVAAENLANLDRLPERGAVLFLCPMLIRKGSGAPARVFALLP